MISRLYCIRVFELHAPAAVRPPVRLSPDTEQSILAGSGGLADERVVLATCERFEIYGVTAKSGTRNAECGIPQHERSFAAPSPFHMPRSPFNILAVRTAEPGVSVRSADPTGLCDLSCLLPPASCLLLQGEAAVEHLLRVASGLESRILGEPHVLGQMREAFEGAMEWRTAGPILNALGRCAIRTGKRVRHETKINSAAHSVVTLALERLTQDLGTLHGRALLVVGSGRLARDVVAALSCRQLAGITIVSRSLERANALAAKARGRGVILDELEGALRDCDGVIACTDCVRPLLTARTLGQRPTRPLAIVDLGAPSNVDRDVAALLGVCLTQLNQLPVVESSQDAVWQAERIVHAELARFLSWARERQVAPEVAQLVRRRRAMGGPYARTRNRALHADIMRLKASVAA